MCICNEGVHINIQEKKMERREKKLRDPIEGEVSRVEPEESHAQAQKEKKICSLPDLRDSRLRPWQMFPNSSRMYDGKEG